MSELCCEEIAHRAGFSVSVGNWIAPNGILILGSNYEQHHRETLEKHFNNEPHDENYLKWMNEKVINEGFIRLVFRADVLFQVGFDKKEDIWGSNLAAKRMVEILKKIKDTEVHIFSVNFYLIGISQDIVGQNYNKLEIKEKS